MRRIWCIWYVCANYEVSVFPKFYSSSSTMHLKSMISNHFFKFMCSPLSGIGNNSRNGTASLSEIFSLFSKISHLFSTNIKVQKSSTTKLVVLDRLVRATFFDRNLCLGQKKTYIDKKKDFYFRKSQNLPKIGVLRVWNMLIKNINFVFRMRN